MLTGALIGITVVYYIRYGATKWAIALWLLATYAGLLNESEENVMVWILLLFLMLLLFGISTFTFIIIMLIGIAILSDKMEDE